MHPHPPPSDRRTYNSTSGCRFHRAKRARSLPISPKNSRWGVYLASDNDRSSYDDYIKSAGISSIPTAFIVGKDGKVEWIGDPQNVVRPLDLVLSGKWDRTSSLVEQQQLLVLQEIWLTALETHDYQRGLENLNAIRQKANADAVLDQVATYSLILRRKHIAELVHANSPTAKADLEAFLEWKPLQVCPLADELEKKGSTITLPLLQVMADHTLATMEEHPSYFRLHRSYAKFLGQMGKIDDGIAVIENALSLSGSTLETTELRAVLNRLKSQKQGLAGDEPRVEPKPSN